MARHLNSKQKRNALLPTMPELYPENLHPPTGFQSSTDQAGGRYGVLLLDEYKVYSVQACVAS